MLWQRELLTILFNLQLTIIMIKKLLIPFAAVALTVAGFPLEANAQKPSQTWNPNLKGGMYRNPVIDADYSDPDVCRVGNDYYMTSSSFQCFPGLQILHSTDLVNWEIIGAALLDDYPVLALTSTGARKPSMAIMYGHRLYATMTAGFTSIAATLIRDFS